MPAFPSSPLPPAELIEGYLAKAFAELDAPAGTEALDLRLGLCLEGPGGGEWLVELRDGAVQVRSAPREEAAFSYVQSVEDWQGALWGERGSAVGRAAATLFRPASEDAQKVAGLGAGVLPRVFEALRDISGLVAVVVTDGEAGDWQVALQLGPGAIPAEPTTTVSVTAGDVDQMVAGELNPMEAFMAGRIRVTGDMTLMLQIQAAAMQAGGGLPGAS